MKRRITNTLALLLGLALGCSLAGCQTVAGFGRDLSWAADGIAGGSAETQAAHDRYRPVKD